MSWWRRTPLDAVRWVVVDCETSGLDPRRDRLLAVGAVSIRGRRLELADAFAAVLEQSQPSAPSNIVIHGIGAEAQLGGRPPREALGELAAFAAGAVPAAFHASFDAEVLRRACKAAGAPALPRRWLDIAQLAPALLSRRGSAPVALDDWLARLGIAQQARHDALSDAFVTAQLLLKLLQEAAHQRIGTLEELMTAARARRWLKP